MSFLYLAALLFSIFGLAVLDSKFKLAIAKSKHYCYLLFIPVGFFLVWDLVGIAVGVFFRGNATHLSGILLSHELPLEEIFFLILFCYSALLLLKAFARLDRKKP